VPHFFIFYRLFRSYITGYSLSEDDRSELKALKAFPSKSSHPHTHRWAKHIGALTGILIAAVPEHSASHAPVADKGKAAAAEDMDDMFGGDDEEVY
jgi:elongation factor 1-beta